MNSHTNRKGLKSAELLIKYTWLRDHEAFTSTDCEIGVVDWERINQHDWNFKQAIMIEVLKFLLTEESNVSLDDLMALNDIDRQAVLISLNSKFTVNELEENLRR